jgi:hypothetical protein
MQLALIVAAFAALIVPAYTTRRLSVTGDALVIFLVMASVWGGSLLLAGYLFTLAAGLP